MPSVNRTSMLSHLEPSGKERGVLRTALASQGGLCDGYKSELRKVKAKVLEELAHMDSLGKIEGAMANARGRPGPGPEHSGSEHRIAVRVALLEQLNFCDYYLSELRKVDANIVDELANLDSADMIEAAAKKASEIAQPFWNIQGITA